MGGHQGAKVQTTFPDGVTSNFVFDAQDVARPTWRYPDLGAHVVYLSKIIARTLTEQMREESKYLRRHQRARAAIKEVVEMPDHQADRLLRSMEQNEYQLSNVMAKEMPVLAQLGIWEAIVGAARQAFKFDEALNLGASVDRQLVPDRKVFSNHMVTSLI